VVPLTYHKLLQTFVAQCEEDYRLLMKLVADTTEALGRRGRIICWFRTKEQPSPLPIDPTEVIYGVTVGCLVADLDLSS
jgi:hypothetical protein